MKKIIYSLPLLLALGACSSEEGLTPEVPSTGGEGNYYLTMNLAVPTDMKSTRSTTENNGSSSDGLLGGTDAENEVTALDLYIIDSDTKGVLKAYKGVKDGDNGNTLSAPTTPNSNKDKTYNVSIQLSTSDEVDAFATAVATHNISLIVVCNPEQFGSPELSNLDVKFDGTITDFGTAGKTMPMASVAHTTPITEFKEISTVSGVRALFTADNGNFYYDLTPDSGTTNNANAIDVERAVARLDLAVADTYKLMDGVDGPESGIELSMYSVTPFNVNNKSYVFRHTAAGNDAAANTAAALFGSEKGNSGYTWVADPSWTFGTSDFTKDVNYLTVNTLDYSDKPYVVTSPIADSEKTITEIKTRTPDTYDGTSYYPWCYVSENTIPSVSLMETDLEKNATGVLFKFQIKNKSKNGVITKTTPDSELPKYVTVEKTGDEISALYITLPQSGKTEKFEPDTDGNIFLTYCGFITHNQGSNSIAAMNYGVVRNNVYQMKVNKIENLPAPDDAQYYLKLDINVLKWNRRTVGFDF